MKVSIIAAVAKNRVIGLRNALPWRLPADLRRFKRLTMGHYLLMGRKTFESLRAPLPGRTIVVITRQPNWRRERVLTARSIPEAIEMARREKEVFIAGGAQIYAETLSCSDCIYLTLIHETFEGDTYFPELDGAQWRLTEQEDFARDQENPYPYSFLTYERRKAAGHVQESH